MVQYPSNGFSGIDHQMNPLTVISPQQIGSADRIINHGDYHSCSHVRLLEDDVMAQHAPRAKFKARRQMIQSVSLHIAADTFGRIGAMISASLVNQFGWMIADSLCSLFIAILISISAHPLLRDSIS